MIQCNDIRYILTLLEYTVALDTVCKYWCVSNQSNLLAIQGYHLCSVTIQKLYIYFFIHDFGWKVIVFPLKVKWWTYCVFFPHNALPTVAWNYCFVLLLIRSDTFETLWLGATYALEQWRMPKSNRIFDPSLTFAFTSVCTCLFADDPRNLSNNVCSL